MSTARAMAILQGASGLPEDRFINTWHFDFLDPIDQDTVDNIGGALDTFYAGIDGFIPAVLTRLDYRVYDMADPMPRAPWFATPTAQPSAAGDPLPYEMAAVMSFYALRNLPRQRGRLYLGPLAAQVSVSTGQADPRIASSFRTNVLTAAEALDEDIRSATTGQAGSWVILSQASLGGGAFLTFDVTNVWVDDAFDVQRRRGTKASTREEISTIGS